MARTSAEDPLKVFRFTANIGGARIGFMKITGLKATTEVSEYREGGDNETPKKSPGQTKFDNVTFSRGQILDGGQNDFYDWYRNVYSVQTARGAVVDHRRDIEITQYDRAGQPAVRWRLHNCFPPEFKAFSDLDGSSNDNSIEELTVAYEGFEKVPV